MTGGTASAGGDLPVTETCVLCGETKSLFDHFRLRPGQAERGGYSNVCIPCEDERTQRNRRDSYLRRNYNLTSKQYDELLRKQRSRCAICDKTTTRRLHVDHDHATGAVRGLLCTKCNTAIGLLEDDIGRLIRAARYLHEIEIANTLERQQQ